jgi:hypothetical protein
MAKSFFEVLFFCKINCLPALPERHHLHNSRSLTCGQRTHQQPLPEGQDLCKKSCLAGSGCYVAFAPAGCGLRLTCGYENFAFQANSTSKICKFFSYFSRKNRL